MATRRSPRLLAKQQMLIDDTTSHKETLCKVPENHPIYQALLEKAASYPPDKPYKAKAYKKAAEGVLNFDQNIYTNLSQLSLIDGVGDSIEDFIHRFINRQRLDEHKCKVSENQSIYQALLDMSASSTLSNYIATLYKMAAENICLSDIGLYTLAKEYHNNTHGRDWMYYFKYDFRNIAPSIGAFIYKHIKKNPLQLA